MPTGQVISVEHLTKRFGDLTAVNDLSFHVERGEILGLLGPNGAGKTTTIQLLLGLTLPDSGKITILGMDIQKHRRDVLQRVNFSSAYIALPSNLTAAENLNIFGKLYSVKNLKAKIAALAEQFQLGEFLTRPTGALSSGQLTRLNLAKAFINDPEVLFLDEPTASLDPDIAQKVREHVLKLQRERGVTMVYTSHNMREVELTCRRVIFLACGKIVMEGSPTEIMAKAQGASLEQVFISIARDGELKSVEPQSAG